MKIAQSLASISRLAGGLFYSVRHLSRELVSSGVEVGVYGLEDASTYADLEQWQPVNPQVFRRSWPKVFGYSSKFRDSVLQSDAELLHTQGIWQYPSVLALQWKRRSGRPHVVSPRGMLDPWAWRYHWWKKRPVWWLWERRNLQSASAIHTTSLLEAEAMRALGLRPPIAVIPNGVELPALRTRPRNYAGTDCGPPKRREIALFISRVHPKKGLRNLVEAWKSVNPANWRMVICGPDELKHTDEIRRLAASAGVADAFEFRGDVRGKVKEELLASASLFILPSFSENFGIAVAEALAAQVPVITTTGTPWQELQDRRCGWWVKPTGDALALALAEAATLSPDSLFEMGCRGRDLVAERYSWPRVAMQTKAVYEWILGRGTEPDCIVKVPVLRH